MKWRATAGIFIFAWVQLSSSAPISFQDDFAAMYPVEYYPAYFQHDFAKIDIDLARWFRNAANSVKHFYSYVNALIFGRSERNGHTLGRYPTSKENSNNASDGSQVVNIHPKPSNINLSHIQALEIYKDSNGNMVMRKLTNQKDNFQFVKNIPVESDVKLNKSANSSVNKNAMFLQMNSKIALNPFHWNEKLEKDELFSGAFRNYVNNPGLLWHSGIFAFQPMGVFNTQDQNSRSQDQSTEPPHPNVSNEPKSTEISDQKEPSTFEQPKISTTVITEETQPNETSNSSNDETPFDSEYSNQDGIVMDIERIKSDKSNSDTNNENNEADPDKTESSNGDMPDETDEKSNDDDDIDLTELDTMQISSDDEDFESNRNSNESEPEVTETSEQDITSDVNNSDDDVDENSSGGETSTLQNQKGTEKAEISEKQSEPVTKNTAINSIQDSDSDESDIAKKVLAIVNRH